MLLCVSPASSGGMDSDDENVEEVVEGMLRMLGNMGRMCNVTGLLVFF